jgi:PAS domain S-box-containing protein
VKQVTETATNAQSGHSDASPAWLWDAERLRILWANDGGLAFFNAEMLFDLIDRPFDASEPGPARIRELKGTLSVGETRREILSFPSSGKGHEMAAEVTLKALPGGRMGVLVTQLRVAASHADASALDQVFEALPHAVLVVEASGNILRRNQAAEGFIDAGTLSHLFGAEQAGELITRMLAAGTVSGIYRLMTQLGERELRLTLRRLGDGEAQAAGVAILEDVTERRQLERELAQKPQSKAAAAPTPPPAPAPRLSEAEQKTFAEIGKALKPDTAEKPAPVAERAPPSVPQVVRNLFDSTAEPILITRGGHILFANARAQGLLAGPGGSLLERQDIAQRLAPLPNGENAVELSGAVGGLHSFMAKVSDVAWYGGPARQVVLKAHATVEPQKPEVAEIAAAVAPATITAPAPAPADEELRAILDTASDGIITLDAEGRIGTFSAGAEAMFGLARADAKGRSFGDLLAPESRKVLKDYLSALTDRGLASVFNDGREVTAIANPGGTIPVFMTISRLGEGFCAVVRDITQWKKTEAELRQAKDIAEKASSQKSEFLARISHELRTPLNAILGFSEVMRLGRFGEIGNDRYRGYVNDIHASGSHLLSLINDLLDLSKVEAGKLELSFTNVDVAAIAENAIKLIGEQAQAGRVILRSSIPGDLPHVVADQRSMQQIMLNLLSNAVKFTEAGGQVIISAKLSGSGELSIRVKDTGIGMSEAELKEALEPFRRVARDRPGAGTGLGLPLTKALAEANRARFAISSEPGKGTLVEITFPTTRVLAE